MRIRFVWIGFILVGLILMFSSCGTRKTVEARVPKYKAKTMLVKVEKYRQDLASSGALAFRTKTDMTATVEGTLMELPVVEGRVVKTGTLLARLGNAQLDMRGRQAEYEVAELESSHSKKKSLLAIGGATDDEVNSLLISLNAQRSALEAQRKDIEILMIGLRDDDLLSHGVAVPTQERERREAIVLLNTQTLSVEVELARSQVDSARMDLEAVTAMRGELELRAPSSGIVGAVYAEKGEHLQQNAKVMTLMNTDQIYAVFPIQESDAPMIREGMSVELDIDAYKGKDLVAKIDLISPVMDAQTGAVTVKALFHNPAMRLRPGMFVRARIDLGALRDIVKLPASAIAQKKGNDAKIFAIVNGRAFLKRIELGRELDGAFIVEKGLLPGEIVIDSPSPLLKEGEDVETEG